MLNMLQIRPISTVVSISIALMLVLSACGRQERNPKSNMLSAAMAPAQLPVVPVVSRRLNTILELPGELRAYQDVPIHAKVEGYISWIGVDRGSVVHKGQPLIVVTAPELDAKVKEAEAKVSASEAAYSQAKAAYQATIEKRNQGNAKLDADSLTYSRLVRAAKTPGAIAQNEVDLTQKTVEADKDNVDSLRSEVAAANDLMISQEHNVTAAKNVVGSLQAMRSYLTIKAPFDGVITERNVHDGSIVAVESSRVGLPLLRIQQKSLLRLVVAVPEDSVAGTTVGMMIPFSVPAFVGKTFSGRIARLGFALDRTTRTMPVEMDVPNPTGDLEPGMFATVQWTVTRPYDTLFVPQSAVATDLKGTFVVRLQHSIAQRVAVTRGKQMNNLAEVVGDLKAGDSVALKATDEIKSGTHLIGRTATLSEINQASQSSTVGGE